MRTFIVLLPTDKLNAEDYCFSASRAQRIARARTPEIAAQWAGAELAFLTAARALGISERYQYLANGQPKPDAEGYFMSLTHTDGLAACALSEVPVGIDAEREREFPLSLGRKIRFEGEPGELREIWVKKESYLKRTGEGILRPMNRFSVRDIDGFLYAFAWKGYQLSISLSEKTAVEIRVASPSELRDFSKK